MSVQTALVTMINLAAVLFLCAVLANLTWVWLAPEIETSAPAIQQESRSLLTAFNLFGPVQQEQAVAAPTSLALRLLGIIAARDDAAGYAVIMLAPGKILAVREGDEIAPGIRLVKVETARLILEREGSRETLTWPPR